MTYSVLWMAALACLKGVNVCVTGWWARGILAGVQQGIPDPIPLEACYLGWQESLELLARLVEAEITEG